MKLNLITIYLAAFALAAVFFLVARLYLPTSEVISLGQFIIELLLVPSILLTLIEIRKIQAVPELDLHWNDSKKGATKKIELFEYLDYPPLTLSDKRGNEIEVEPGGYASIILQNSGKAIGLWYSVQIFIPGSLWDDGSEILNDEGWEKKIGDEKNWQLYTHFGKGGRRDCRITFMSNGQFAVYPENPLLIGGLSIPIVLFPNSGQSEEYEVPYVIYTDNSKPVRGVLTIKLRGETIHGKFITN